MSQNSDPWPDWSKEPFVRFFDYVDSETRLIELATNGIRMVVNQARVSEALYGVAHIIDQPKRTAASQLADALVRAEQARREVEADFPLLHAHSLVGLWGALEALVTNVAVSWLTHRKALLKSEEFASIKVPLGEFHTMSATERIEYVVNQMPRPAGGFQRFESLMDRLGLGGPLEDELRRTLIELHQVRNVYAHRGGIADKQARAACPWRKDWKLGKPILVNNTDYGRYLSGITGYVVVLMRRIMTTFGVDIEERAAAGQQRVSQSERKRRYAERRRLLAAARRRIAAEEAERSKRRGRRPSAEGDMPE